MADTDQRSPLEKVLRSELDSLVLAYEEEHEKFQAAEIGLKIASVRLIAVREHAITNLGLIYWDEWIAERPGLEFIGLTVGQAIVRLLRHGKALTQDEIRVGLREGGFPVRDGRRVNAALIRTKGIEREGDTYRAASNHR